MCLALPARVLAKHDDERITIDLGGIRKDISAALTPEVRVDDYVIVHVGYAIGVVDPEEAARTLALFAGLDAESQQAAQAASLAQAGATPATGGEA